jgi:glycosyltransferase involved in cell wall biosynthesis
MTQRLAVAVVIDGIEDSGGQHGQATAIAAGLARAGHEVCYLSRWAVSRRLERVHTLLDAGVDVLTPRWVHPRPLRPTADDVARLRRLAGAAWAERRLPSRSLLADPAVQAAAADDAATIAVGLLRRWRRQKVRDLPLVVHVLTRPTTQYLHLLRAIDAPIVFSEFGSLTLYGLDLTTAERLEVDAYTTDNPDAAHELEQIEGSRVSRIPCIAGSHDPTTAIPEHASRFAVVNRLVDYKHTDVAVRAAASRSYDLDVYGDGPELPALRGLVSELDATNVHLHGLADARGVRAGVDAAHAFVSCSRLDGTPMAVLEAMSRGRGIVGHPIPGVRTLVDDGVEGLYFDGSPADLGAALDRLAAEPGLAAALGANARARWERDFSPAVLLERYEAVYRSVLR